MVATTRANALAWSAISRSSPNCASTWARNEAIAEIVATAWALRRRLGCPRPSHARSGCHGSAGSPAALKYSDRPSTIGVPGSATEAETLIFGSNAESGSKDLWQKQPISISFSARHLIANAASHCNRGMSYRTNHTDVHDASPALDLAVTMLSGTFHHIAE